MSEKQNNFVKIWAVVAPLAALAGLYYVHSRRRRTGNFLLIKFSKLTDFRR